MCRCWRACLKCRLRSYVIAIGVLSWLLAVGGIFYFITVLIQDLVAIPKKNYLWEMGKTHDKMYKMLEKEVNNSFDKMCHMDLEALMEILATNAEAAAAGPTKGVPTQEVPTREPTLTIPTPSAIGTPSPSFKKREVVDSTECVSLRSDREDAATRASASPPGPLAASSASLPQHWIHQEDREWQQSPPARKPKDDQTGEWEMERYQVVHHIEQKTEDVPRKAITRDVELRFRPTVARHEQFDLKDEDDYEIRHLQNGVHIRVERAPLQKPNTTESYNEKFKKCLERVQRVTNKLRKRLNKERNNVFGHGEVRFHIVLVLVDVIMLILFCLMLPASYALIAGARRKSAPLTLPWVAVTGTAIFCAIAYWTIRSGLTTTYSTAGVVISCIFILLFLALFFWAVCVVGRFLFYCFLLSLDPDTPLYRRKAVVDRKTMKHDVEN